MRCAIPLLFAFFAVQVGVSAAEPTLGMDSPFLPPAGGNQAVPQEQAVLEFRGVMSEGGEMTFNIVEVNTHKGAWVRKDQSGYPFKVVDYRKAGDDDLVVVEAQGRRMDLRLAKAKIAKVAAPVVKTGPLAPTGPQPVVTQGPITPVVLNPTAADTNKAMEDTIAEVRRRRLARQQQATPAPGAASGTDSSNAGGSGQTQAVGQAQAVPAAPPPPIPAQPVSSMTR